MEQQNLNKPNDIPAKAVLLILLFTVSTCIYFFQQWHEETYGYIFGKSDITNYYDDILPKNRGYYGDPSHYVLSVILRLTGFPFFSAYVLCFSAVLIFYWAFYPLEKGYWPVFTLMFGTSYVIHAFYVCILSQTLAFLIFMISFGYYLRKEKEYFLFYGFLSGCIHFIVWPIFILFNLLYFFPFYSKKIIILNIVMTILFLNFYLIAQHDNLGAVLNTKINEMKPPTYFIWYMMLNPFLIGLCYTYDRYLLTLIPLSLMLHNGRLSEFTIPFVIYGIYRYRLRDDQRVMIILGCIMYFFMINIEYIGQTMDYLNRFIY